MTRWVWCAAVAALFGAASVCDGAAINEVRIDQTGADNDEFVEIAGTPLESLDGLYLVAVGDNSSNSSGVIENVLSLNGHEIPDSGYYLVARPTFTLAPALVDQNNHTSYENSDNVTIMLVSAFTGDLTDDLDTDDDGVLDVQPWSAIVDSVALIEEPNPPSSTEFYYGLTSVGPDDGAAVFHAYRSPDITGAWVVGAKDVADGVDTPGAANPVVLVVAVDDFTVTGNEDGAVAFGLAEFQAHFTDSSGAGLATVRIESLPSNGVLSLGGSPVADSQEIAAGNLASLSYAPDPDWSGGDSFCYNATGATVYAPTPATVALTIAAVNDAPVAYDDAHDVAEDGQLTVDEPQGVLVNDVDVESDALEAALVDGPAHGVVTLATDGGFVYAPDAEYNGTDQFTYVASDGDAASSTATVVIDVTEVNDAPVASDDSYEVEEGQTLDVDVDGGLLANDEDVEGAPLQCSLLELPTGGSLTLHADGSFSYTPSAGTKGSDSFVYRATDGALYSEAATVSIVVAEPPPVAPPNPVPADDGSSGCVPSRRGSDGACAAFLILVGIAALMARRAAASLDLLD